MGLLNVEEYMFGPFMYSGSVRETVFVQFQVGFPSNATLPVQVSD